MKRSLTTVKIGETTARYTVRIDGEPCSNDSNLKKTQMEFLAMVTENPMLLNCGTAVAAKIVIQHNGECWTLWAEAEGDCV